MPIQAKIIENPSKSTNFPKLMNYIVDEDSELFFVVLFNKPKVGMVVLSNYKGRLVGDYENNWAIESFKDYDGGVELKNV